MKFITDPSGKRYAPFLDVSGWQFAYTSDGGVAPGAREPDYSVAVAAGFGGVFHRIGNGMTFDQSFPLGYRAAVRAGLPMGAYYYAQPNVTTGAGAARWCADRLRQYPELRLPLMLDFEAYNGQTLSPPAMYAWLREFFNEARRLLGRAAILYAGSAFASATYVGGSLADIDTVQPRYSRSYTHVPVPLEQWSTWIRWASPPNINLVLGDWEAWQFSSSADWLAYGGPSDCRTDRVDVNIARLDAWAAWLPIVVDPTPTPTPLDTEDVTVYQVRHREPTWPGEAVFNVTADAVIHLQNGDAANVDAFVGGVPTVSNTQAWRGGDEQPPGSFHAFSRTMLLQLLRDPARRHESYVPGVGNVGQPFSGSFGDPELAEAWVAGQRDAVVIPPMPPTPAPIPTTFTTTEEVTRHVTLTPDT